MSVYIVSGLRTPIGAYGGSLSSVRPDDMLALVISKLMEQFPAIAPREIDDVIVGCTNQAGEDNRNIARMALLLAGLPYTVSGETINRLCASGMSAVINGARAIANGDAELILAGGVESMSRAPFVFSKSTTPFSRDVKLYDSSIGWRFSNQKMQQLFGTESMGETAENLVEKYKIDRRAQDEFAFHSQLKAIKAQQKNRFEKEITPVQISLKKNNFSTFVKDEFIREDISLEKLSKLAPAFKKEGSVTAGNSTGINDGAAILLLASEKALKKYNLNPLAKIISSGIAGVHPSFMGIGPVSASEKALKKAKITLDKIDIIELNEAFAVQCLACLKEWNIEASDERLNPNGGAIALGHPLGMSGARLLLTAALELQEQHKKYALATMCVGVGQGYAVVIEKC